MRPTVSLCVLGLVGLGCIVKNGDDPDVGTAGQGGGGHGSEQGGSAGSSSSAEGGAAGAAENDCSLTADDDVCSSCVKNECCAEWWACLNDCSIQIECYVSCLQERYSLAAEDDAACREECSVAGAQAQTQLIACLLPKEGDDEPAGCRDECFL
jgi:hypothetical protein